MGFYKKVKFPIEITKGKAKDLYKLRFMRKSELEPSMRHNLRQNALQLDRQVDLWFKEQSFTIGSLKKEQEKVCNSRKILKNAIRRNRRREYARRQEEIRLKLKEIKMKIMMMKVVQKFKDNVRISKGYRHAEESQASVENLHISGNKQQIHDPRYFRAKSASDERTASHTQLDKLEMPDKATSIDDIPESHSEQKGEDDIDCKSNASTHGSEDDIPNNYDLTDVDQTDANADNFMYGVRQQSSQGPRMETIPEETEEVEVDMEDLEGGLPRLTKKRLTLLNRSKSQRDVFDGIGSVPLLPEVSGHHVHLQAARRREADTADKETQTSDKTKSGKEVPAKRKKASHLRKRLSKDDKIVNKKTIVVKLPRSKFVSIDHDSVYAKGENFGSDSDEGDYPEETTDTDPPFGFESDLITSETDAECWDEESDSDDNDDDGISYHRGLPEEFSLTLTKYKTTLRRKTENSRDGGPFVQSCPTVTNIEADLPNITTFNIQNPYSLRFKERSFFVKSSSDKDRRTGSARSHRQGEYVADENTGFGEKPYQESFLHLKHKRKEAVRKMMQKDNKRVSTENPLIAVYGRKADSSPRLATPPNSPGTQKQSTCQSPRRNFPSNFHNNVLYTQKRVKEKAHEKIHDIVTAEPVQRYERTRSGKIRPFGTPRIPDHEIPSLKEQYIRDKLLKAERDKILRQNIKMKKFIDTFDSGPVMNSEKKMFGGDCIKLGHDIKLKMFHKLMSTWSNPAKLPAISSNTSNGPESDAQTHQRVRKKTIGNIFFQVYDSEQELELPRKVIPSATTTSLRQLKSCRYLREYNPEAALSANKETSWDTRNKPECRNNYIANVRIHIL